MTWFRSNCRLTNLRHLCADRRKQVNQIRSHLPCSPGRAPRCRTRPGASDIIRKCLGNEGRGVILFGLESCGSCQGAWPDLRLPRDPFAHQKRSTKTLGASTSRPAQAHRAKASAPQAGAKAGRPIKGPSKRTCKRARPGQAVTTKTIFSPSMRLSASTHQCPLGSSVLEKPSFSSTYCWLALSSACT